MTAATRPPKIVDGTPTGVQAGPWREIWRIDREGNVYRIWEKLMPRIDDSVLDCAIYLYYSEQDANEGEHSGGSGFLVGVPIGWDRDDWDANKRRIGHIYAVTNAHLVEVGCSVIRLNTHEGSTKVIGCSPESWIPHPQGDDLAITRIEPDHELYKFKSVGIDFEMFITKAIQNKLALGPGDETFTVGRFIARDERQANAPIVRFGHISGLGTEFISVGRASGEFKQESFLVESHSISGFSGSPVFIWIPLERTMRFTNAARESEVRKAARLYQHPPREYLLGVNWGHLEDTHPPGMAGVVPAWKLLELLKLPEVVEMRREKEKSNAKIVRAKLDVRSPHSQKTLASNEADRIDIPVPTEREVINVFKKVTRKRKPSS